MTRRVLLVSAAVLVLLADSVFLMQPGWRSIWDGDPSGWVLVAIGIVVCVRAFALMWWGVRHGRPN